MLIQSTTLDITCDAKTVDISLTKNWNFYNLNTVLLKGHISGPMLHWIWLSRFFIKKLDMKYLLNLYMCFHSFQFSCINNGTISEKKYKYLAGRSLNRWCIKRSTIVNVNIYKWSNKNLPIVAISKSTIPNAQLKKKVCKKTQGVRKQSNTCTNTFQTFVFIKIAKFLRNCFERRIFSLPKKTIINQLKWWP